MSAESLPEEQELLTPAGPPWFVGRLGDQEDAPCIKPLAGVAPRPESNHPIGPESPD